MDESAERTITADQSKKRVIKKSYLVGCFLLLMGSLLFAARLRAAAPDGDSVKAMIGPKDSLLVADPGGQIVMAKNQHLKLVPASILKVFTSLGALHFLGADFRYPTEFYIDQDVNLKIKGYGDPLLISEIVNTVSKLLAARIGNASTINDIVVDDAYFSQPLTIPGISSSSQPYDAPNGALCVNFNTVFFKRTRSGYASAESQTPLLPFAEEKIRVSKATNGRIVLSHEEKENTIYAGKLFGYFLARHGVRLQGTVKPGRVNPGKDKLIYRHLSRFTLTQIIAKLLEHSNNFTTNQLLITCGIKMFGPPGNLDKGVLALKKFADDLDIGEMQIAEGSGISRNNKVSAAQMLRALVKFEPHRGLMRRRGRECYKTGNLHGISTRAGYIASRKGGFYRFVIMINTAGKSTKPIMRLLLKTLD